MTRQQQMSSGGDAPLAAATAERAAALDAPVPLAFLNAFLSVRDLLSLRAVNRSCLRILPHHTRQLVGSFPTATDTRAFALLATYFPHVTTFALRECKLQAEELSQALQHVAGKWTQLRALELSAVWHLRDAHVFECTQLCSATLESLTIAQCYQVKTPTIIGPRLRCLRIQNCFFAQFGSESRLPALQELHIVSQVLSTLHARHLIKRALLQSAATLRVLSLSNCGALTQVLIDPLELPTLRLLDLTRCHTLERVHVASQSLERLDLSLCVELQHVVLDLPRCESVDLSFLKALTHLFLRAEALRALSLGGCGQLDKTHLKVFCPALQIAHVSGSSVALEDLNSTPESDMTVS